MSGRAGRRGLDKHGTVIILPTMDLPNYATLKGIMSGRSPSIKSKFIPSYQFILKALHNVNWKKLLCRSTYSCGWEWVNYDGTDGGYEDGNLMDYANETWSTKIRYVGVGAMLVGGLWSLLSVFKFIIIGLKKSKNEKWFS